MIYWSGGNAYALVRDHKNGWNPEAFRERFSEVLERYDYVVGDWGYNQLRLRGFFREPQPKVPKESVISHLFDYINEYCNFGCAYFVLEKLDPTVIPEGVGIRLEDLPQTPVVQPVEEGAEPVEEEEVTPVPAAAAISIPPGGMLLRWPLKERPGGRVPGTSPSAVARAVSEGAERRAAAAQHSAGSSKDELFGRGGVYESGGRQNRNDAGSRDRRPGGASRSSGNQGQGGERRPQSGGYSKQQEHRSQPRDGGERAQLHSAADQPFRGSGGSGGGHSSGGGQSRGGGKWPSKSRRRGPQGQGGSPGGAPGAGSPTSGSGHSGPPGGGGSYPKSSSAPRAPRPRQDGAPRSEGGGRPEGTPRPERGTPAGNERKG